MMKDQPPRRRHELFHPLTSESEGERLCLSLTASAQQIGAILQDSSHSFAYGTIVSPSGKSFPLPDTEIHTVTAIALCHSDPSLVAIATENGTVQIAHVDASGSASETWEGSRIARESIAALQFVPPCFSHLASLVALSRDGNLVAVDVAAAEEANLSVESETTSLLSSAHQSSSGTKNVKYHVQTTLKLADVTIGSCEHPTGAMVVIEENVDNPLVLLGMSGGTLLTMARAFDENGYTWICVKKLSLPSTVFSLALSSQGAHKCSQHTMLAAGLAVRTIGMMFNSISLFYGLHLTSNLLITGWRSRIA